MAIYTKNDLVERILVRLGEVGFGQADEPEARARVLKPLDGILDELCADQIYDFAGSDEIPGAAFDPLSAIIAARLSDDFGVPPDQLPVLSARAQNGEARLRRYRALEGSRSYTQGHYF